ncbi:hypothetical protein DL770_008433 [Monosporascus sp. CRB-9-2]|nr:hypothetical protein DL770_008433 [Monosporascus sp. CRB-9-2]
MTNVNITRFNADAQSWDANPDVQRATTLAHKAYLSHLPPASLLSTYNVLDLGCGTGLLSLLLAPSVRSLTAVDAAPGMVDALQAKLSDGNWKNVRVVCALLEDPDDARLGGVDPVTGEQGGHKRFDLVVSHLMLHHIPDLKGLLRTVYGCLVPGGRVMVTDFENFGPDARRFHPEAKMDGVERQGIGRVEMSGLLEEAGFGEVRVERAFEMAKRVETTPGSGVMDGEMVFPFLICEGRKV